MNMFTWMLDIHQDFRGKSVHTRYLVEVARVAYEYHNARAVHYINEKDDFPNVTVGELLDKLNTIPIGKKEAQNRPCVLMKVTKRMKETQMELGKQHTLMNIAYPGKWDRLMYVTRNIEWHASGNIEQVVRNRLMLRTAYAF